MFLGMEGIQADMSSRARANPRSLCHCLPTSGHQGLAVTWELGAVRSMLGDARVGGRLSDLLLGGAPDEGGANRGKGGGTKAPRDQTSSFQNPR